MKTVAGMDVDPYKFNFSVNVLSMLTGELATVEPSVITHPEERLINGNIYCYPFPKNFPDVPLKDGDIIIERAERGIWLVEGVKYKICKAECCSARPGKF